MKIESIPIKISTGGSLLKPDTAFRLFCEADPVKRILFFLAALIISLLTGKISYADCTVNIANEFYGSEYITTMTSTWGFNYTYIGNASSGSEAQRMVANYATSNWQGKLAEPNGIRFTGTNYDFFCWMYENYTDRIGVFAVCPVSPYTLDNFCYEGLDDDEDEDGIQNQEDLDYIDTKSKDLGIPPDNCRINRNQNYVGRKTR